MCVHLCSAEIKQHDKSPIYHLYNNSLTKDYLYKGQCVRRSGFELHCTFRCFGAIIVYIIYDAVSILVKVDFFADDLKLFKSVKCEKCS